MARVLDPLERVSEVLFGIIMVLTFTSTFSVVESYHLEARTMVASALACNVAWGVVDGFMYILGALTERSRERDVRLSGERPPLEARDWLGAAAVFLLVILSTFPIVVPFILLTDAHRAIRWSNGIAIAMMFGCGVQLGRHARWRPWRTGAAVAAVGVVLVAVTIALGG